MTGRPSAGVRPPVRAYTYTHKHTHTHTTHTHTHTHTHTQTHTHHPTRSLTACRRSADGPPTRQTVHPPTSPLTRRSVSPHVDPSARQSRASDLGGHAGHRQACPAEVRSVCDGGSCTAPGCRIAKAGRFLYTTELAKVPDARSADSDHRSSIRR